MESLYYELLGRFMEVYIKKQDSMLVISIIEQCARIAADYMQHVPIPDVPVNVDKVEKPKKTIKDVELEKTKDIVLPKNESQFDKIKSQLKDWYLQRYEPVLTRFVIEKGIDTGKRNYTSRCCLIDDSGKVCYKNVVLESPEDLEYLEQKLRNDSKKVNKITFVEPFELPKYQNVEAGTFYPKPDKIATIHFSDREKELYTLMKKEPGKQLKYYAEVLSLPQSTCCKLRQSIDKKIELNKGVLDNE